nr:glutaminase [Candidatus Brachybacter algidus]
MDYQKILEKINADTITLQGDGEISLSIPELAIVNPDKFGIHLLSTSSIDHQVGDSNEKFSIQSISKVFHFQWPYHFRRESLGQSGGGAIRQSFQFFDSIGI